MKPVLRRIWERDCPATCVGQRLDRGRPTVAGLLGHGPGPARSGNSGRVGEALPGRPKRVYLVGHSMGAGHAVQLAQQEPGRFAAVAALGGGGRIGKEAQIKDVRFFVGCGKLDFALESSRTLHRALEAAKRRRLVSHQVSHLLLYSYASLLWTKNLL